jgi:alkanesulfonate monooxygenase SsuD/methylene tetrahydromethanopterin reductase-like flavin-dependent oxidoreductase (luciferase family)
MAKPVELGVHTGQQDIELDELRKLWRHCDEAGFDLITVWDHFYESPPRDGTGVAYESLALLSALALDTSRSRIGCLCFGMTYRNPAVLAKALTTIDHLSKGRLTVGLGAGWHIPEHEGFGIGFPSTKERLDRLSEGVQVVRMMFTRARSNFEGNYYRLKNAANIPPPVQERVPIIIGGGGEQRTMAIAARRADGSNQGYLTAEMYKHKNEVLDQWCERYDRDPKRLQRSVLLHFHMSSKPVLPNAVHASGSIWGEAQQVIDTIGEYVDAGAQLVTFAIRPPIDWEALQSFIEDVKPAFG